MVKFGLAPVSLLTLLATGFLLYQTGWFASRSQAAPVETRLHVPDSNDLLTSDAAYRHRKNQATHWKRVMLIR